MSKNFALRSAAALTTLFIVGCSTDKPALESIAVLICSSPDSIPSTPTRLGALLFDGSTAAEPPDDSRQQRLGHAIQRGRRERLHHRLRPSRQHANRRAGLRVENCLQGVARIPGAVQQMPDASGARTDALLAATSPSC